MFYCSCGRGLNVVRVVVAVGLHVVEVTSCVCKTIPTTNSQEPGRSVKAGSSGVAAQFVDCFCWSIFIFLAGAGSDDALALLPSRAEPELILRRGSVLLVVLHFAGFTPPCGSALCRLRTAAAWGMRTEAGGMQGGRRGQVYHWLQYGRAKLG